MVPIKPHAYAELPDEFHTCQMWQGFKNPLLVQNRHLQGGTERPGNCLETRK